MKNSRDCGRALLVGLGILCLETGAFGQLPPPGRTPYTLPAGTRNTLPHARTSTAPGPMQGPMLGYVWDAAAGGLRGVSGIPGAAVMGDPQFTGQDLTLAAVGPERDFALFSNNQGRLLMARLPGAAPLVFADGVAPGQQIVLSPSGNAALVFSATTQRFRTLSGLPDAPVTHDGQFALGAIAAGAISDDGTAVVATRTGNLQYALYVVRTDGSTSLLAQTGVVGGLAFLQGRDDLLFADAGANTLSLATGVNGAVNVQTLATSNDGLDLPFAVSVAADSRTAWVANDHGVLVSVSLTQAGVTSKLSCNCTAVALAPLGGNQVFRLTAFDGTPLAILDGDSGAPQVMYIPAPAKLTAQSEAAAQ